jgi:hypothetical protein
VKGDLYMMEGCGNCGCNSGCNSGCNDNISHLLAKYIGQTVTVFTKSGGQSGCGFTGVILGVNDCFVRLITSIGPAPGCALGNACGNMNDSMMMDGCGHMDGHMGGHMGSHMGGCGHMDGGSGFGCGFNQFGKGTPVYNVGSVTDIPICSIASFVHNAI